MVNTPQTWAARNAARLAIYLLLAIVLVAAVLQVRQRRFGFGEDRFLPCEQQVAEIFLLPLVHERLVVAGNIIRIEIGLGFAESVGTYFGNIGRHEERPSPFLIAWLAELGEPRIAPGL